MERLKASKYLNTVERADGFAVYHSLFGGLTHVDSDLKRFLDNAASPEQVETMIPGNDKATPKQADALIEALRSRSFLVAEDADEYDMVRQDMRHRNLCLPSGHLVRALQLIVSNKCNFGCKFCFFKDHNSASRLELNKRDSNAQMSFDMAATTIEKVLEVQRRHRHKAVNIEFFGGEPLMNWPVVRSVLEKFSRYGKEGYPNINYSITTNGKAVSEEMAAVFKAHDVTVTVSYNFPVNGTVPDRKKYPNFSQVSRSLEILKATGNILTFNTVLSKEAIESFDPNAYVAFCRENQVQMIGLILDLNLEFYKDEESTQKAMDIIMSTFKLGKAQGIPVVGYWHEPFAQIAGHQALNFKSGFKCCPGEGCKLSVEPDGDVFVCKGCSHTIGNIADLEGVFSHPQYREYAFHAYRNAPQCEGCPIENFCSTGCMGSIERHYDTIHAVDEPWCRVFKELTFRLIRQMDLDEFGENRLAFPSGWAI